MLYDFRVLVSHFKTIYNLNTQRYRQYFLRVWLLIFRNEIIINYIILWITYTTAYKMFIMDWSKANSLEIIDEYQYYQSTCLTLVLNFIYVISLTPFVLRRIRPCVNVKIVSIKLVCSSRTKLCGNGSILISILIHYIGNWFLQASSRCWRGFEAIALTALCRTTTKRFTLFTIGDNWEPTKPIFFALDYYPELRL